MEFIDQSCKQFVDVLSGSSAVPGGGGASALVGAVGIALGNMVASLTVGKKKYKDVEEEMLGLKETATSLQDELLSLVQRDAQAFEPLSKAYGLPRKTDEEKAQKDRIMESALREATAVPLEIMEKCCNAIDLHREFANKGSIIAISDAGVGVTFCKAALIGASLNVYINTKAMTDRPYAGKINSQADYLIEIYTKKADDIYNSVLEKIK